MERTRGRMPQCIGTNGAARESMSLKQSAEFAAGSVATLLLLTGCSAIAGIFKAGVWVGVVAIVFVLGLVALVSGLIRR